MNHITHKLTAMLLAAALCVTSTLAAGPVTLYPAEVRESQNGDFRRVEKIYLLDASADPADIPTEGFEREGYQFTLLDLIREDRSETETRPQTKTVTQPSKTQDMAAILAKLEATFDYKDEDGFSGTLTLDPKSIKTEAAGYQSSSKTVTASRTYPGLSEADASLLPKTIQENGRTLDLSNVSWQTVPGGNDVLSSTYTAAVTYTGTASSSYATGYTVTASYTGDVTRTVSGNVVYTAVFTGALMGEPVSESEAGEPSAKDSAPGWITAVCVVLLVLLILSALFNLTQEKQRKERKNYEKTTDYVPAGALPDSTSHHGGSAGV